MTGAVEIGIRFCFGAPGSPTVSPVADSRTPAIKARRPTAYSLLRARLANWREWEMNPVLLKELRQAVRSRILIGTLMSVLGGLFLVSVFYFVRQDLSSGGQPLGIPVFRALLMILTAISVLFVPLFIGIRLGFERRQDDLDLMFITALSPVRIVRGKLLCGVYLVAMFFSICSPFMVFTNLLRGVDLPTIFFVLICLFSVSCLAIQVAIFVACLPLHWFFKNVSGLIFAAMLVGACLGLARLFLRLLGTGIGMQSVSFWFGFVMSLLLVAAAVGVLQLLSLSLIMADNRPRGYFDEVIKKAES